MTKNISQYQQLIKTITGTLEKVFLVASGTIGGMVMGKKESTEQKTNTQERVETRTTEQKTDTSTGGQRTPPTTTVQWNEPWLTKAFTILIAFAAATLIAAGLGYAGIWAVKWITKWTTKKIAEMIDKIAEIIRNRTEEINQRIREAMDRVREAINERIQTVKNLIYERIETIKRSVIEKILEVKRQITEMLDIQQRARNMLEQMMNEMREVIRQLEVIREQTRERTEQQVERVVTVETAPVENTTHEVVREEAPLTYEVPWHSRFRETHASMWTRPREVMNTEHTVERTEQVPTMPLDDEMQEYEEKRQKRVAMFQNEGLGLKAMMEKKKALATAAKEEVKVEQTTTENTEAGTSNQEASTLDVKESANVKTETGGQNETTKATLQEIMKEITQQDTTAATETTKTATEATTNVTNEIETEREKRRRERIERALKASAQWGRTRRTEKN